MDLNSIIFALTIKLIKIFLRSLTPYFKFILFIITHIKPILWFSLTYLLIVITVTSIKKYKHSVHSNNKDIHSTIEKNNINLVTKCNTCKSETNFTTEGNKLKQTNLALIFAGISLLINPACIFSILSIIFGIVQLSDNDNKTEKDWTIVSIIISILITLFYFFYIKKQILI